MLRFFSPLAVLSVLFVSAAGATAETRWSAALELSRADLGSVDEAAVAGGARLTYRLTGPLSLDAAALLAPADIGEPAFSASQTELSAGLRVGTESDPVGFYAAVRGGSVRYAEAPAALACIAIFPPPLPCVLSAGYTAPQIQLAAGLERRLGESWLVRLEAGDRLVRLPGPAFDASGEVRSEDFWSHELRLSIGLGLRF